MVKSKLETIIEKTLPIVEKKFKNANIETIKDLKDPEFLININLCKCNKFF
jgi:hypothetical protein